MTFLAQAVPVAGLDISWLVAIADKLGVTVLLLLIIVGVLRKWFIPCYVLDEMRARAERAEIDGREWKDLAIQFMTRSDRALNATDKLTRLMAKRRVADVGDYDDAQEGR